MATHKLFLGGLPQPYSYGREMFPSVDFPPYVKANTDYRKFTSQYANSRHVDFACSSQCLSCGEAYAEADQLRNYFDNNTIAVGDIIELIGISMENVVEGVWWKIMGPLTGFQFQMQVKGDPASTVPAPVNVGPVIDASTAASGFVEFDPRMYFSSNGMFQIVVVAVPAPTTTNCNSCTSSAFSGLDAWFSVVGFDPCRGDRMS